MHVSPSRRSTTQIARKRYSCRLFNQVHSTNGHLHGRYPDLWLNKGVPTGACSHPANNQHAPSYRRHRFQCGCLRSWTCERDAIRAHGMTALPRPCARDALQHRSNFLHCTDIDQTREDSSTHYTR
ncbi:unnamed protein product [Ectocarpus sp. 8 AP-2014]